MNMRLMKTLLPLSMLALLACGGCTKDIFATHNTPQDLQNDLQSANNPAHGSPASGNYAADEQSCNGRAAKRMTMYDRPDTYPISQQERRDGYQSLYSECMREHNWQVAGPVHTAVAVASNANVSNLAALSPAAGGNMTAPVAAPAVAMNAGNTLVQASSIPGATVLVIGGNTMTPTQLSALSPAAGGSATALSPTVIMVQPQAAAAAAAIRPATVAPAANAPLPVAVPLAPEPGSYSPNLASLPRASGLTPHTIMGTGNGVVGGSTQPSLAGAESNAAGTALPPVVTPNYPPQTVLKQ